MNFTKSEEDNKYQPDQLETKIIYPGPRYATGMDFAQPLPMGSISINAYDKYKLKKNEKISSISPRGKDRLMNSSRLKRLQSQNHIMGSAEFGPGKSLFQMRATFNLVGDKTAPNTRRQQPIDDP